METDMPSSRKKTPELDHAFQIVEKMAVDLGINEGFSKLTPEDIVQLERFTNLEQGPDKFIFPIIFGNYFLKKEQLPIFHVLSELHMDEYKVLYYTAIGHDSNLISESLEIDQSDYWHILKRAKKKFADQSGLNYDPEIIISLHKSLDEILKKYLLVSDEIDDQQNKSKEYRKLKFGIGIGLMALGLTYLFLWNQIFPPQGDMIFANKVNVIEQMLLASSDTSALLLEVKELIHTGDYSSAFLLIDQENGMMDVLPEEIEVVYIYLIIREELFSQVKVLLKEYKKRIPESYERYFKGLIWSIRFTK